LVILSEQLSELALPTDDEAHELRLREPRSVRLLRKKASAQRREAEVRYELRGTILAGGQPSLACAGWEGSTGPRLPVDRAGPAEANARAAHRARSVIGLRHRGTEVGHDPVAQVLVERAAMNEDRVDHTRVVVVQQRHHLLAAERVAEAVKSRRSLNR